jgi:hypothetical protein
LDSRGSIHLNKGIARFLKIEYSGKSGLNGLRLTWKSDGRLGSIMDRQVCPVFENMHDFEIDLQFELNRACISLYLKKAHIISNLS